MKYLFCLVPFLMIIQLQAQPPGSLDPSFGNGGIALGVFPSDYNNGFGIYQQSDGKLLNVGSYGPGPSSEDFYLLRYLPNGTLDSSFGINGSVTGSIWSGKDEAWDVIQQVDSKILVIGVYDYPFESDVFIRRYDSTGVLDSSFANGGMVTTDFQNGSVDVAYRVKLQHDGKIVVIGFTMDTLNNDVALMLMRYNPDGTLDSTFGNGGKVSFSQLIGAQFGSQLVIQPDGKVVAVGYTEDAHGNYDILVVRFLPNGSLDNSFNGDGIFTFELSGNYDEGYTIVLQPNGKILIGGFGTSINGSDDIVIRLDSSGYPDPSFNSTGILTKDHNQSGDHVTNILLQSDGKIITVGQSYDVVNSITLTRYLSTGADDNTFGINGSIIHSLGNGNSYCSAAILQSDNRIVITGGIYTDSTSNNYTARFENDLLPVGVYELNARYKRLYPLPARDKIYIEDFKPGSYVTVFDSRGQIVYHSRPESNSLDIAFLTPGIYLLRIESGREQFSQKFIKQ